MGYFGGQPNLGQAARRKNVPKGTSKPDFVTRLDETLAWYEVIRANRALADRVVRRYPEAVPEGSPFYEKTTDEAAQLLAVSAVEIGDLTVLALTSFFEE